MVDALLMTGNRSKAVQILGFFEKFPIRFWTPAQLGFSAKVIEDGKTLRQNGEKKARFGHDLTGGMYWTLAEDTGLFIRALGGEPGIYAARWLGENVLAEETMHYCLERMKDCTDRSAVFRTCAVLISPRGDVHAFDGEVTGHLLREPRCAPQPSMPYSPLFVPDNQPDGQQLCWAEMTTEYENAISHRGIALRKVRTFLEEALAI